MKSSADFKFRLWSFRLMTAGMLAGAVAVVATGCSGEASTKATLGHQFGSGEDEASLDTNLLFSNGAFFGTTGDGGTRGFGTVFMLTPPPPGKAEWEKTTLYSFKGDRDGKGPSGPLAVDRSGAL